MPSTAHRVSSEGGRVDERHSPASPLRHVLTPHPPGRRWLTTGSLNCVLLTAYCLLLTATAYPGRRWLTIATLSERVPKGTLLEKLEEYEEAVRAAREAALAAREAALAGVRALCRK